MIGDTTPAEWREESDPETGRTIRRLTDGRSNSYALYYFVPSMTPDGRFLVVHSERSGDAQLYRIDLVTGEIGQLTAGHTKDAGWAVWCEWHVDGIYTHLSAIHPVNGEVWYFQDDEIRATDVASFRNRTVARLPAGRMPIGQAAFSPDGRWFAHIHADAANFTRLMKDRELRETAGTFDWDRDHQRAWRNAIPTTLTVVNTLTGDQRDVISTDYHFHHVLFVDDRTLLINHPRECAGMWVVDLDGSKVRHLRSADDPGAHGAMVNHQVITARGIAYEAVAYLPAGRETYLGMYDTKTDTFSEALLPAEGYVHVGFDPAGRFDFVEDAGDASHRILAVDRRSDGSLGTSLIRRLSSPNHDHQRHHGHPFLSADRRWLTFTDWSSEGFAQVCQVDVGDLVAAADRS